MPDVILEFIDMPGQVSTLLTEIKEDLGEVRTLHQEVQDIVEDFEGQVGLAGGLAPLDGSGDVPMEHIPAAVLARSNHTGTQPASTISDFAATADARIAAAAGVSIPSLVGGFIPTAQIPATAITDVFTAANEAAMLALGVQRGDVVVRTDLNRTYMHNGGGSGTMADFTLLDTPTDAVTTVNGQQGTVVLAKGDIGLPLVDNTSDAAKPVSTATQAALNGKLSIADLATQADVADLSALSASGGLQTRLSLNLQHYLATGRTARAMVQAAKDGLIKEVVFSSALGTEVMPKDLLIDFLGRFIVEAGCRPVFDATSTFDHGLTESTVGTGAPGTASFWSVAPFTVLSGGEGSVFEINGLLGGDDRTNLGTSTGILDNAPCGILAYGLTDKITITGGGRVAPGGMIYLIDSISAILRDIGMKGDEVDSQTALCVIEGGGGHTVDVEVDGTGEGVDLNAATANNKITVKARRVTASVVDNNSPFHNRIKIDATDCFRAIQVSRNTFGRLTRQAVPAASRIGGMEYDIRMALTPAFDLAGGNPILVDAASLTNGKLKANIEVDNPATLPSVLANVSGDNWQAEIEVRSNVELPVGALGAVSLSGNQCVAKVTGRVPVPSGSAVVKSGTVTLLRNSELTALVGQPDTYADGTPIVTTGRTGIDLTTAQNCNYLDSVGNCQFLTTRTAAGNNTPRRRQIYANPAAALADIGSMAQGELVTISSVKRTATKIAGDTIYYQDGVVVS